MAYKVSISGQVKDAKAEAVMLAAIEDAVSGLPGVEEAIVTTSFSGTRTIVGEAPADPQPVAKKLPAKGKGKK